MNETYTNLLALLIRRAPGDAVPFAQERSAQL